MLGLYKLKAKIKAQETPLTRWLYPRLKASRYWSVPCVRIVYTPLYYLHCSLVSLGRNVLRIVYWTPLFKTRLSAPAKQLYLFGGMPTLLGPLTIKLGKQCRLLGNGTVFIGRCATGGVAELIVGNNVDISCNTLIAVSSTVSIGNNVRIAEGCLLLGFPGHPLDPVARAVGQPDTADQCRAIILEEDVWLASHVKVVAGVRFGRGSVIATGSVVTKDIPPGVLAAGVPARVLRSLNKDIHGAR